MGRGDASGKPLQLAAVAPGFEEGAVGGVLVAGQDEGGGVQTVASLAIGYDDVTAQSPGSPVRKELWTPLLLAALAVLVFEWYIYNRRVYV